MSTIPSQQQYVRVETTVSMSNHLLKNNQALKSTEKLQLSSFPGIPNPIQIYWQKTKKILALLESTKNVFISYMEC